MFESLAQKYNNQKMIILFLNKAHLLEEKLVRCELSKRFPDYTGGQNCDAAIEFIKSKFFENLDKTLNPIKVRNHFENTSN